MQTKPAYRIGHKCHSWWWLPPPSLSSNSSVFLRADDKEIHNCSENDKATNAGITEVCNGCTHDRDNKKNAYIDGKSL